MDIKGNHITCDVIVEEMPNDISTLATNSIEKAGLNVVEFIKHQFSPQGETLVWILSESHFVIHTYPEHNYLSIDCYTCGDKGNPLIAITELIKDQKYKELEIKHHQRGGFR